MLDTFKYCYFETVVYLFKFISTTISTFVKNSHFPICISSTWRRIIISSAEYTKNRVEIQYQNSLSAESQWTKQYMAFTLQNKNSTRRRHTAAYIPIYICVWVAEGWCTGTRSNVTVMKFFSQFKFSWLIVIKSIAMHQI